MIRNDGKIGNYWVLVYARRNSIASFECPTWEDVETETNRIAKERRRRGLPTTKATARQLLTLKPNRRHELGPMRTINLER